MIQTYKLTFRIGLTFVFKFFCLNIKQGSLLLLHGSNGSGKTSFLKVLGGQIGLLRTHVFDSIYIDFANDLKYNHDIRTYLSFWSLLNNSGKHLDCVLYKVGLWSLRDRTYQSLSSGQKRRFYIAYLLLSQKPLWLLDEPTIALDSPSIEYLELLIEEHRFDGGTCVIATHTGFYAPSSVLMHFNRVFF